MGTGLGPESYAIIEQGRIGQILSFKPQDRRSVIEEAAGITRFKQEGACAKPNWKAPSRTWRACTTSCEEVTRQVNSLKRQASKASVTAN